MVSVEEATKIIQHNLWKGGSEVIPLMKSINRIIAEPILADRDLPPFDRVTMDGIAIAHAALAAGQRKFPIQFVQSAGAAVQSLQSTQVCAEVMTGAMLPLGADTVIRYEDITIQGGEASVATDLIKPKQNIHKQSSDAKQGAVLIEPGTKISSAEIPLLASVGVSRVSVKAVPRAAIISTGDELVDVEVKPHIHQIRKSNVYALAAALAKFSIEPTHFHFYDDEQLIQHRLQEILEAFDLVILSGGVSKGKFDFIPRALESNGIQKKFHQISQRPGKPMWFGVGDNKAVFALPGNPVSTFLCYYRYVEPWLITSLGSKIETRHALLETDFKFDAPLTYFLQVKIKEEQGKMMATPVPGGGSGDFVNLIEADGFLELPLGQLEFKKGDVFRFVGFR